MMYGVLLPVASLATTLATAVLFILAATAAGLSAYFFRRAKSREEIAPKQRADGERAVSEMRALGDRIETLVSQQQLQGETQRQRLGQKIDEVQQVVSQQGHRVDGLRGELRQEVERRDQEIEEIRQQLTAIQQSGLALPAAETPALPPAPAALRELPAAEAAPASPAPAPPSPASPASPAPPAARPVPTGDSFAGVEALPPPPPAAAPPEPAAAPPQSSAPADPFEDDDDVFTDAVFSDMGFDAFSPGEPASLIDEPGWNLAATSAPEPAVAEPAAPVMAEPAMAERPAFDAPAAAAAEPAPPAPADEPATSESAPAPLDGSAWVSAQREPTAPVPVFRSTEWDLTANMDAAPETAEPTEEADPTDAFVAPDGADDFSFISTVTDDVQRALYMAGVTKLEEIAHWSRSDARRISSQVGVSEETIMNQWVFEAQGALFERYSSHVGG